MSFVFWVDRNRSGTFQCYIGILRHKWVWLGPVRYTRLKRPFEESEVDNFYSQIIQIQFDDKASQEKLQVQF